MSEISITARDDKLVRALGVGGLSASVINMTVGAGIFALPGVVAARLGGAAVFGYLACAAGMTLFVLCFAAAGSRVSLSGGLYGYVRVAFGTFAGFICGAMLWLSCVLASAAVANIFVDSLSALLPAAGSAGIRALILLLLYAALAAINIRGIRLGARFVKAVTVAKLLPLLILVCVGVFFLKPGNLTWPGFPSVSEIGNTALVLIFAFLGVEVALTPSGEVKDPARTVPRAILLALAGVTALYLLIQFVAQGVLGSDLGRNTSTPLAAVAGIVLDNSGRVLVLAGAVISTFGYVLGDMLAAPRALFGMANDRTLPAFLGSVHPVFRTPRYAIVTHAILAFGLAASGSFERLIIAANLAILVMYTLCALAVIQLQRLDVRREGDPFKLRGGPVIPAAACAFAVWLASHAEAKEFTAIGITLAAATVLYFVARRKRLSVEEVV